MNERPGRTAVIGAGVAGLTAARGLAASGASVTVFEKSRGRGGRLSTRRSDGRHFDHGAQYFSARGAAFRSEVARWVAAGAAAHWEGIVVRLPGGAEEPGERFVGVPGMSGVGRHLAAGLDVRTGVRVTDVERAGERWLLRRENGPAEGPFDTLVVATPAEQARPLLACAPQLAAAAAPVRTLPCWAVMLALPRRVEVGYDGAFVDGGPLAWIARDASKPARPATPETWVLHATPEWTADHLGAPRDAVAHLLAREFRTLVGARSAALLHADAHLWRYARTAEPLGAPFLWDASLRIGACGDWCLGARVEAAFDSGRALADEVAALAVTG